jgi:hypothetical protein
MKTTCSSLAEVESSFISLYEECCDTCLWFWCRSVAPTTLADRIEALRQIEQNGTLRQFKAARELRKWL